MRLGLACLGLAAAVFVVFGRVAGHEFVAYDTRPYITENPWVLRGLTLEGIGWALTSAHAANWHPLTWISHMVDVDLFGPRPGLHALENVAWHAANSCLLLVALVRMTGALGRSLFVAALFAVHPLHVESVAWVVERKDVLSTFFGFACFLAWERWTRGERRSDHALACLFLALGLLAKPMLVTWPFVLLLFDVWPLRRTALGARRLLLEKLPLFALAAGSAVVTVIAQRAGGALQGLDDLSLGARASNAAAAYAGYLGKAFWPSGLAFYYPLAPVGGTVAGIALALLTAIAVALRRKAPWLLVGWLFFLGTLVPVIGLVQVGGQAMADRYTYVPLLGVFVAVAWGLEVLGALRAPLAGACLLVLGLLAWRQTGTWKDTETLARHALAVTEENHVAHDLLGAALEEDGKLEEAEREYRAALAIAPGDADAAGNLAAVLQREGRLAEAEGVLRAALALSPLRAVLHHRRAVVLQLQERTSDALAAIDQALVLQPTDPTALHVRGQLLEALGRPAEARAAFERALAIAPSFVAARLALARLLLRQGDVESAEHEIALAIAADPRNVEARRGRARALLLLGREREAREELEEVLRLQPAWPLAMGDLAFLLAMAKDPSVADAARAVELAEQASTLAGEPGVEDALAAAYASAGRFDDALRVGEHARELALQVGETDMAARIEKRVAAYRAGQVDRETPR